MCERTDLQRDVAEVWLDALAGGRVPLGERQHRDVDSDLDGGVGQGVTAFHPGVPHDQGRRHLGTPGLGDHCTSSDDGHHRARIGCCHCRDDLLIDGPQAQGRPVTADAIAARSSARRLCGVFLCARFFKENEAFGHGGGTVPPIRVAAR